MSYRYRLALYFMLDHPDWGVMECIRQSKQTMKGWKWPLFVMDLSFLGWMILELLTFGILSLWVSPISRPARPISTAGWYMEHFRSPLRRRSTTQALPSKLQKTCGQELSARFFWREGNCVKWASLLSCSCWCCALNPGRQAVQYAFRYDFREIFVILHKKY